MPMTAQVRSACVNQNIQLSCGNQEGIHVIGLYYGRQVMQRGGCGWESADCTVEVDGGLTRLICDGQRTCSVTTQATRSCPGDGQEYNLIEYRCIPSADVFPPTTSSTYK
jgi:hypothetical protein